MPRRLPSRTTTRNSGSTSSRDNGNAGSLARTAVATSSLTKSLVACLVDRLQKIAQDRFSAGHDLDGADHTGNDRIGLPVLVQYRTVGRYSHLVVGLAGVLV